MSTAGANDLGCAPALHRGLYVGCSVAGSWLAPAAALGRLEMFASSELALEGFAKV